MAAKLPGFEASVGTAAQPEPKFSPAAVEDMEGAIDGAGAAGAAADGAGAGAVAVEPPPQADSETVQTAAAATTANFSVRIRSLSRMDGHRVVRRRGTSGWDTIG
jgi:hypothetical protein